jgi:hypothetical protein
VVAGGKRNNERIYCDKGDHAEVLRGLLRAAIPRRYDWGIVNLFAGHLPSGQQRSSLQSEPPVINPQQVLAVRLDRELARPLAPPPHAVPVLLELLWSHPQVDERPLQHVP